MKLIGSSLEIKFECFDCGMNVEDEYFMLNDDVWNEATNGVNIQFLCVGCIERSLGRKLRRSDFKKCPLNDFGFKIDRSDRLTSRMGFPRRRNGDGSEG